MDVRSDVCGAVLCGAEIDLDAETTGVAGVAASGGGAAFAPRVKSQNAAPVPATQATAVAAIAAPENPVVLCAGVSVVSDGAVGGGT